MAGGAWHQYGQENVAVSNPRIQVRVWRGRGVAGGAWHQYGQENVTVSNARIQVLVEGGLACIMCTHSSENK